MLTHRALVHEYVSCIAALDLSARDVPLHALPLYHSAQMHVFLMPSLAVGATNHLVEAPDIDGDLRAGSRATASTRSSCRRPCGSASPSHPRLADARPHRPAQGVLRRVDHARAGAQNACAQRLPGRRLLQLLRPVRDRAAGDGAAPRGARRAPGLGGARGALRRDCASSTRRATTSPRRARRGHLPLAAAVHGLLGQAGGDGRGLRGRLVPLRRPRARRRGGLHLRRGPRSRTSSTPAGCSWPPARSRTRSTRTRRWPRWRSSAPRTSSGSRRSPRSWSCARPSDAGGR